MVERVLRKALDEYRVVGVSTNVDYLRTLVGHEAFINGQVKTGFISVYHLCLQ
jgi:3-methylcrotonyl-CoA carboxylase alpha subunit